ncbi:hypothetical protein MLD38_001832 [Melastoma candidum]|uniref:Uncharacterized protein n=1 Tax=Melastoma candidum TaxID=119954 RepID=A0ACB9SDU0_9MYRT|nr:hypothetical protein MLD38_001832 [Melastoma candidum]
MEEVTESCSSRFFDVNSNSSGGGDGGGSSRPGGARRHRKMADVYDEVLRKLRESDVPDLTVPGFEDDLWSHFNRLPPRYASDVNVEKAEDVLLHKRLLDMAQDPATRPAIEVRLAQVPSTPHDDCYVETGSPKGGDDKPDEKRALSFHLPAAFGSSSKFEVELDTDQGHSLDSSKSSHYGPLHEVIISTNDKPKFLSQLTSLMSEIGLNIQEAHAFSTSDGYSLDIFSVDGWESKIEELKAVLKEKIQRLETVPSLDCDVSDSGKQERLGVKVSKTIPVFRDVKDVWEINVSLLNFEKKIASGSHGDLYKGTFCGQDVAIKALRTENLNKATLQEFAQEVYILRKIRHKNVVPFIGACTKPPRLCIVTEYMSGGSVFDFLQKQKTVLDLSTVLRLAIEVSKGMDYLHKNKIVHRDLKAANLLMDEYNVVKIADFGVARVQTQSGVMTAETGTYRWMAPEVVEHKPYNHKADVFSFGIVLWELLTTQLPYEDLTPLQAAVGVVHKGLRPTIPPGTHPEVDRLLKRCWQRDASLRPEFSEIVEILQQIALVVED